MTREERLARSRAYRAANKDRINAQRRAAYAADPGKRAAYVKAYRAKNAERVREWHRRYNRERSGIADADAVQKTGRCDVAGCAYHGPLHLDHWHSGPYTGRVRGWLCPNHNRGIGQLGDSVEGLKNSLAYLLACETREASQDVSQLDGTEPSDQPR